MTRSYVGQVAGSDYNLHVVQRTESATTVLQPLVVLGEPEIASYRIATASAIAVATANSHLLQIMAGASLRVGIRRLWVYQQTAAASTSNDDLAIYRLTTAGTGGTSITPAALDPADAAAGCTAMTLPSSKGAEGTLIEYRHAVIHATPQTVGHNPLAVFDFTTWNTKALWIAAGTSNGIALKNLTSDASATVRIVVELVESEVA